MKLFYTKKSLSTKTARDTSSLDSSRSPRLRSPGPAAAVERSVKPRASTFLTARGAQGGMFLNGDGLDR